VLHFTLPPRSSTGAGASIPVFKAVPSGQSKDPGLFTVLFEDAAAMAGLVIALAGLLAAEYLEPDLGWTELPPSASDCCWAAVAIFLCFETKGLLIGEAVSEEFSDQPTCKIINASDAVNQHQRAAHHAHGP
jgi:hypothetical protein